MLNPSFPALSRRHSLFLSVNRCIYLCTDHRLGKGRIHLEKDTIEQRELSSILHAMLLAYERRSREMLNEDQSFALVSTVSNDLARELTGLNDRLSGKTVEQKLHSLANLLVQSKLVGQANVVKHGSDYEFCVEACNFALTIRKHESEMILACPWGMIASSIASRASGRDFHPRLSIATDLGTCTRIKLQRDF